MKKILSVIFLLILINATIFLSSLFQKEAAYIAVVCPVKDKPDGQAILMGINLYLDKINKQGGIGGREIKLNIYDDNNDPEIAENVASEIENRNEALIVLGHLYSGPSRAAGEVYKRNEIPVITGSAVAQNVTLGNDWYFRTIPNNTIQGGFIANYIYKVLNKDSVNIIFSKGDYGTTLAKAFEKASENLGIEINRKWEFDTDSKNWNDQAKKIADELKAADDQASVFLSTDVFEGAEIAAALKYLGKNLTVIGSDAFSDPLFLEAINEFPMEKSSPGYYSDGIYCSSAFMPEIGMTEAVPFAQEFFEKYNEVPGWLNACYYDAVYVAIEAIKKAGIKGKGHIREDRENIRNALKNFYSEENAVRGVSGYIYFDENGDLKRPYSMGIYKNQKVLPMFSQYSQISDIDNIDNIPQKILNREIIVVDGIFMRSVRVVYAGMDIIEVSVKRSEYTADFYLWFRYSGDFDDTNIEFINPVNPVKLGQPLKEEIKDGITKRLYRVKASFKADFDFRTYPFDHQVIPIRFRHIGKSRDELIYIPDVLSLPDSFSGNVAGWNTSGISFFQDIASKNTTLGDPKFFRSQNILNYSQFNTEIRIKRKLPGNFIFTKFFPIAAMLMILYLVFFIQPDRLRMRVLIFMSVLLINLACHLKLLSDLPVETLTTIDSAFLTIYIFVIISALISVFVDRLYRQGENSKIKILINAGRIVYPSVVLAIGLVLVCIYWGA